MTRRRKPQIKLILAGVLMVLFVAMIFLVGSLGWVFTQTQIDLLWMAVILSGSALILFH